VLAVLDLDEEEEEDFAPVTGTSDAAGDGVFATSSPLPLLDDAWIAGEMSSSSTVACLGAGAGHARGSLGTSTLSKQTLLPFEPPLVLRF
jgi:hypothetical protein